MSHPFKPGDRVNAYLRDSGGEEQDLSVPQQEKVVREFCAAEQLILVHLYKDEARKGGTTAGRDAFDEMLDHYLKNKAPETGLILWSFARFARNDIDAQIYKNQLRKAGYKIHSLSDKLPEGLHGRLIEYVIDYSNALFLENLSKEVKRGQRHLVLEYGGIPGTPPRGFTRERVEVGKRRNGQAHVIHKWIPRHDDEWERCRLAWEMRAGGVTLAEIRQKTRLYKSNTSYHSFFRNKLYLGILEFGNLEIPAYCEPLITEQTWRLVQEINQRHRLTNTLADGDAVNHPNRVRGAYMLTGLARCGVCGSPLNGNTVKLNGQDNYAYYYCNRAKRRKDCPNPRIPRDGLERTILAALAAHVLQPETLAELQEESHALHAERTRTGNSELDTLRTRLTLVQGQVSRLVDAISRVSLTAPLEEKYQTLELERLELHTRISLLTAQAARPPQPLPLANLTTLAEKLQRIFTEGSLPVKREILQSFVHQIIVTRTGADVRVYLEYLSPTGDLKATPPDLSGGAGGGVPPGGENTYVPRSAPKGTPTPGYKNLEIVYQISKKHKRGQP